jgi:hypothetical protein
MAVEEPDEVLFAWLGRAFKALAEGWHHHRPPPGYQGLKAD